MNWKLVGLLTLTAAIGLVGCMSPTPTQPPTATAEALPPTETLAPTEAASAEETGPWNVVLQTEVDQAIRMGAFLDDQTGYWGGVGGDAGRVHYTTDGGQTWTLAETSGG